MEFLLVLLLYLCFAPIGSQLCRSIPFETPCFRGEAVLWIKGLPTSPPDLFEGQKRKTLITIQGKFKRKLLYNDLVSGQEFFRPLKNIPSMWLVESVLLKVGIKHGRKAFSGILQANHGSL